MNSQERKMVGLGITVTEKMASVTQDGPRHLWDLMILQNQKKANKTFNLSLEPSCGMQKAQRNPDSHRARRNDLRHQHRLHLSHNVESCIFGKDTPSKQGVCEDHASRSISKPP